MATDKKQHWQNVVFEPSGVTPGTYDRPSFTVNEFGFLTNVSSSATPSQTVIPTIGDLPGIPAPVTGDLAIVLDNGGGEEEIYVWNDANVDLGAPYIKWRLIATTEMAPPRVNFRNTVVSTAANTLLGAPTSLDAKVKAVHVTITSVYDPGTTMRVSEAGGAIWMPTTSINTQLTGTYTEELQGNDAKLSTTGQLQAEIIGAPLSGASLVYVEYVVQA